MYPPGSEASWGIMVIIEIRHKKISPTCIINTVSCPIIFNSNTIELAVHTSCYFGLGLTLRYKKNYKIKRKKY